MHLDTYMAVLCIHGARLTRAETTVTVYAGRHTLRRSFAVSILALGRQRHERSDSPPHWRRRTLANVPQSESLSWPLSTAVTPLSHQLQSDSTLRRVMA
jgi:hypothetical protein